jgi:hypothetical protein
MKIGDLIADADTSSWMFGVTVSGIILSIDRSVEVPPLLEVLWDSGYISKCYSDDVCLISDKEV